MRFISRALSGGVIALICLTVLALGARPYIACAPFAKQAGPVTLFGFDLTPADVLGACALDREGGRRRQAAGERSFTGLVGVVRHETVAPTLIAYGEILSGRTLELRSPAAGRLVDITDSFRDGAQIGAGQRLFTIDPATPAAARADAAAALAEAEADAADAVGAEALAQAELAAAQEQRRLRGRAVERQQDLLARGTGSQSLVEDAELAMADAERAVITREQARAAAATRVAQTRLLVRRAEIALAQAERDVVDTEVVAPFAGVLQIDAGEDAMAGAAGVTSLGRLVSINERLGALIDPTALEAAIRLSDADFARLLAEDGSLARAPASVVLDLGGRRVAAPAQLLRASATVAAAGGRLVYAALGAPASGAGDQAANPAALFRPGDFVEVRIEEPPLADVARLPARAVSASGGLLALAPTAAPDPADPERADENRAVAERAVREGRLREISVQIVRRLGDELLVRGAPEGVVYVRARTPQLGEGVLFRAAGEEPEDPLRKGRDQAPPTEQSGDRSGAEGARPNAARARPGRDGEQG